MSKHVYQFVITGECDDLDQVEGLVRDFEPMLATLGSVRVRQRKHTAGEGLSPEARRAAREVAAKEASERARVAIETRQLARRAEREERLARRAERVKNLQARRAERAATTEG